MNDGALLGKLRQMWQQADPVPDDLAERVVFAVGLEDVDYELLRLREVLEPAGARGAETARTVTFGSDSLSVMVTLSGGLPADHREPALGPDRPASVRRIDGWIAPGAALRVELRTSRGVQETMADTTGRFALTEVPPGLVQLVIHPTEGASLVLSRPVVTPALQL
jgi:hypothetical protein